MKVIARTGTEDIAFVYIADMGGGRLVEFVESLQPPIPRERKWVLIVSTLFGCPVGCRFCDAGRAYGGKLTGYEILAQIDYLVRRRFPSGSVPVEKFKVQFARMGDPAFNGHTLDVLEELPGLYGAPGLMPSVSTIAPEGTDQFFERLLDIKRRTYAGRFQLQFSIHTTDEGLRDWLMPARKWSLERIASYGEEFFESGGRKVTLNFALADGMPVSVPVLSRHFSTDKFVVKVTPVNPTFEAKRSGITSKIVPESERYETIDSLRAAGFEVILSIGELEENHIGSNCGQYVADHIDRAASGRDSYTYSVERI